MKLSIIVPVYNAEKYLNRCIDSILGQSMQDFELILVNDGSSDSSQNIIDDYVSENPNKVFSVTIDNGGQGRARNYGIEIAKGDYLGFIDSDDWIEKDMFEKLCSLAEREAADIAVCDFRFNFSNGDTVCQKGMNPKKTLSAAGSCCNKIFRRELIGDIRYPLKVWYEDFEFSAKLLIKASKVCYIPETLYNYRIGQISTMTNDNSMKNLDMITVMENIREFMAEKNKLDEFECFVLEHVLLDTVNRVASQKSRDKGYVIKQLLAFIKKYIPNLLASTAYKAESSKRRIIMFLNYYGLAEISQLIFKIKRTS